MIAEVREGSYQGPSLLSSFRAKVVQMGRVEEFWIKYELEDGMTEWEGPYRSELMAGIVAFDFLTYVPEAITVTTYLKLADEKKGTVETVRLLTRRRDTVKGGREDAHHRLS